MKKFFAGLGVFALVALGTTAVSFPATADAVQPVTEIVAESDAIVASPDAVLVHSEPVVTTTAAEVPAEPVAAPVRPYVAPAPTVDPYSGNPIVDCAAQGLVRAEDYSCVPATFYAPAVTLPPCDDEDEEMLVNGLPADACYWDAKVRGSGDGKSFTKYAGDKTVIVYDK